MLILNSGFIFRHLWQVISTVLPERTKCKIKLCSSLSSVSFSAVDFRCSAGRSVFDGGAPCVRLGFVCRKI